MNITPIAPVMNATIGRQHEPPFPHAPRPDGPDADRLRRHRTGVVMSARQQARMEQASTDAIRGAFADKIPPMEPTLRDLAIRAIETDEAFHGAHGRGANITDTEYLRLDEAAYDAQAALRAHLMGLGLDKSMIASLAGVL